MYDDNFYTLLEAEGILPVWLTTGTVFVMCNFKNNFLYFIFVLLRPYFTPLATTVFTHLVAVALSTRISFRLRLHTICTHKSTVGTYPT